MHNEENSRVENEYSGKPCLNCDTPLLEGAAHCYKCGQSIREARMTVRALLSNFFSNLFNLDGKIWSTLRHMWKPAFLTKEYVSGKRMSYFNPARFFAITLILHFLLMTYFISHTDLGIDSLRTGEAITKSELVTQYDTIASRLVSSADSLELDTLRYTLFGNAKHVDEDTVSFNMNIGTIKKYGILRKDAYSMTPKRLYKKYEITEWWEQLLVRQTIRINKNKESTIAFIIGNLTWVVMLVLFFIASVMKLLYIRGKYYYVEHAVLMMNMHAKTFFLLNIMMLLNIIIPEVDEDIMSGTTTIIYLIAIVYLYITMKVYYQQGWFKTLVKFFILGLSYLVSLIFFLSIVSIIGAAIF